MKKIKYLLICVLLLTCAIFTVHADSNDDKYNAIMGVPGLGNYLMVCQPDDALVLNAETTVTTADLTDNYLGGVVNLPRLASDYYYVINDTDVGLTETTYPCLRFTDAGIGKTVTLKVCNVDTKDCVYSCQVTIGADITAGYNTYYTGAIPDVSENLLQGLIESSDTKYYSIGTVHLYPHSMHKTSLVMESYVISNEVNNSYFERFDVAESYNIDEKAYVFKRNAVSDRGTVVTSNVKEYLDYRHEHARSGLLVTGSKSKGCTYDSNTGNVTTITEMSDANTPLYYAICRSGGADFGKISTETVFADESNAVDPNAPKMVWNADTRYDLSPNLNHSYSGLTSKPADGFNNYGPVSFDNFWSRITSDDTINVQWLRTGKYSFTHYGDNSVEGVNVYANTLIFAGCIPHLGTADLVKKEDSLTIDFYYKDPSSPNDWVKLGDTVTTTVSDISSLALPELPTLQYYTPNVWYTDIALTKKFDASNISTENKEITLFGDYTYSGDIYTVTFYNDMTGAETSIDCRMDQLPTLPTEPEGSKGYVFKNWHIVSDKSEMSGKLYDPNTFTPEPKRTYIFKTMWDAKGIIVKVLTSRDTYYVGQEVDKSTLQVHVQDSADVNNTRILDAKEYTISNAKISLVGVNQFVITYTATGATKTCEVKGVEIKPTGIKATYKGSALTVGTEVTNSMFDVYVTYNSGETKAVTDFTISDGIIKKVGKNTVKISYLGYSTTVDINGLEEVEEEAKLSYITAVYLGKNVYVGDILKADDFSVVAYYDDDTAINVQSSKFKFSPNKFSTPGKQYVKVTYGGKSDSCAINVKASDKGGSSNNNNNDTDEDKDSGSSNNNSNDYNYSDGYYDNYYDGMKDTTNTNNNSNNSNSNNSSNNSSTGTGTGSSSTSSSSAPSSSSNSNKGKGTSPGYLSAANILTNVANLKGKTGVNEVDIKEAISKGGDNINITLINGNSGNTLTPEMLQLLRKKRAMLYVKMVSHLDDTQVLANWSFNGASIGNVMPSVDLNVNFDVTDKESDRLLCISVHGESFPLGTTLSVTPTLSTYESAELIRMYSCDLMKSNVKLLKTFTWLDTVNTFSLDIYKDTIYCLSNAGSAYAEGSSLLVENTYGTVSGNDVELDDEDAEDDYDFFEDSEDDESFDFDDEGNSTESKFNLKSLLFIVVIILVVLIVLSGGLLLILRFNNPKK